MDFSETERSIRSSFDNNESSFESGDEDELQWAKIERLPTIERRKTSLLDQRSVLGGKEEVTKTMIDVTKLGSQEKHLFIENLINKIEEDNRRLLLKLRKRIQRVGLELPTLEVRFKNLSIDAECEVVDGKPLPTLWNTLKSSYHAIKNIVRHKNQGDNVPIIEDASGIIRPSRLTLLLGPPGCGKTTLLRALSGKLDQSLKMTGDITYNGYKLNEFVPQKTSAYISQYDQHISEMTVRETLDFSARCQGIGSRAEIMMDVLRKEKQAGLVPEPDIDTYMKAISIEGLKGTLQTDYILKILGLDICAETNVGDAMRRGISGGQKKRLTTGEMIIGPTKVLFMDEISNGLDSSTTFQIVSYLQQLTHIVDSTILVSLLQPAPETFDLFDDIIVMAEGKIVYQGPRVNVLEFFEDCGFRCPARKGTADFLQEVVSKKDQVNFWCHKEQPYNYISTDKFVAAFKEFHIGKNLNLDLSRPLTASQSDKKALSFNIYSLRKWELFKACMSREWVLMRRNSFVHVFKSAQLVVIALLTMTVFIRTRMKIDVIHANIYMGSLFYSLIRLMVNGIAELSLTASKLTVFYKQRDFCFYPAWAFAIPAVILKIPFSMLDAFLWTGLTYYAIGYSPEPERFFCQFLLLFLLHQVSISIFRLVASLIRNPAVASSCSLFSLLLMFLFGGFIIKKPSLPSWIEWGFWLSPLSYAEIGITVNEFLAPRWQKVLSSNATTIGDEVLIKRGLNFSKNFYWISLGALLGFWILLNIGFTCALTYLKPPGKARKLISHERLHKIKGHEKLSNLTHGKRPSHETAHEASSETSCGMVLPFEPITISFESVQYFVGTPKERGYAQKRLQLLKNVTGAFKPGILTALMGVSGAGKTTLMDVLSGRKTGGKIEGDIRINGYLKVQETYARISGYCEQSDIHSPQITIEESLIYSAWLRLPSQIAGNTKSEFIKEVLQMIELDEIKDDLVGTPGVSGISTEQRKRLTIAVELVSNPSIIFMDEPTSGLDARSAAIVMRVVQNIVRTGRTIVCTIHQPSIDIFEAFDELILMKRGGQIIYSGEIGQQSDELIKYFEGFLGVPKINEKCNPATWMLEVTSPSTEAHLGLDFVHLYKESERCRETEELVRELKLPKKGSKELHFVSRFPQNGWEQFKACLWKQHLSYWRSPKYNLVRLGFITASSLLFGALLWQKGQLIEDEVDLFTMLGAMFIFVQFLGIGNCSSILPYITNERTIMYRERFAGMYSPWTYSFAQVTIEVPYIFLQTVLFVMITYPTINFYWSIYKVFWYFYTMFCTLLNFTYLGMLLSALTPTYQVAAIFASFCYTLLNLFAGFVIPGPEMPKWWVWCYWICPNAWSLNGLLTSQYGDITNVMVVNGAPKPIKAFLESYYGFNYDRLGITAIVLFAFPFVFASAFAYSIAKLNFQKT